MFFLFIVVFRVLSLVDFDKQAANVISPDPGHPVYKYTQINITQPGYTMKGHFYVFDNPVPYFHIYAPSQKGCACREKTTDSSKAYGCKVATNAGFFIMSEHLKDYCIGDIVSDSKILHYSDKYPVVSSTPNTLASQPNSHTEVDFGLTKDGDYIIGFLGKNEVNTFNFTQLIGGVIWLVRKGEIYAFIDLAAPRTSIGFDKDGKLIISVFEGYESKKQGPNLYQLAQIMLDHGVYNMINVDGGGSSTVVEDGKMYWPTGTERAVTTMFCVKPSK